MNKQSSPIETQDIEGFDSLQKEYQDFSKEMPSTDIDKQIIAAAHLELAQPNPRKNIHISWWRRLMLPVYVAATFTFTAIAAHWFWPQDGIGTPAKTLPGTAPATVSFEVVPPQQVSLEQKSKRQKRELPEPTMLMEPPTAKPSEYGYSAGDSLVDDTERRLTDENKANQGQLEQGSSGKQLSVSGARTSRSQGHAGQLGHPNKEDWAREIIAMFRNGELEKARKEMVRFKQVYPDYPLDQQLEPFRQ